MIEYILFVMGIFLLIKGADYLVDGASSLAKRLGVPTLVIGLTIVAFGTSMPELVVNLLAAINGSGEIAFGNIVGSSMANILLILGIAATITTLKLQRSTIWKEIPFSFLAVLLLLLFSNIFIFDNLKINSLLRTEGIILLLFFVFFIYYVFGLIKKSKGNLEDKKIELKKYPYSKIIFMIIGGLVSLYFGGKWTVDGAVFIARTFGLSEFLISATIIAIGTSLPELFTTISAARKKDIDLAVGNIIGSNIFNIFWILGITSIIKPIPFPAFVTLDLVILLFVTFLLFMFMFVGKKHELDRWQGILFLILYLSYLAFLIIRG